MRFYALRIGQQPYSPQIIAPGQEIPNIDGPLSIEARADYFSYVRE